MDGALRDVVTDCSFFGTLPEYHDLDVFLLPSPSPYVCRALQPLTQSISTPQSLSS